jgi:hypothetical protein
VMALDSTLPLQLEGREKENAQNLDCLRLGERINGRPSLISGDGRRGGGEFNQLNGAPLKR